MLRGGGQVSVQRPQSPLRLGVLTKDSQNSGSVPHCGSRFSGIYISNVTRWEGPGLRTRLSTPRGATAQHCLLPGMTSDNIQSFTNWENSSQARLPELLLGVSQADIADLSVKHPRR